MRYVLFPYERVEKGSKCVLYGMGWLGNLFLQQISLNHYCEIVYAVDKEYRNIKSSILSVKSPTVLKDDSVYDYVIIAILNASSAESVAEELSAFGIPKVKFIYKYPVVNVESKSEGIDLERMDWMIRGQLCRMLYGLESYAQNEFLQKRNVDWKSWPIYQKASRLMNELRVYDVFVPHGLVRVGRQSDGGYVLVAPAQTNGRKLLYGFGVGDDISFELQMAEQGYEIYLYDHTVKGLPQQHGQIHYYKRGLTGIEDEAHSGMSTLLGLLQENGHEHEENIILKMDIEGAELDVFLNLPKEILEKFSQIVMEIHNLTDEETWDRQIEMLTKLNKTHRLVHLHANNYSRIKYLGDLMISEAVEVTYVRGKDFQFKPRQGFLLEDNDFRCDAEYRPERIVWQE